MTQPGFSFFIKQDFLEFVRAENRKRAKAVRQGLREAARNAVAEMRAEAKAAGLKNLGRRIKYKVYAGRRGRFENARAWIYLKGGERLEGAMAAFNQGVTIRSKTGRFLWIPTGFNLRGARRGQSVIYRPDQLKNAFVRKSQNGTLILFAKVQHAQARRNGVVRNLAAVNDHILGSGRVRRSEKILERGIVPMFILVPKARIEKRLNSDQIAAKHAKSVPRLIAKHWRAINAG